MVANKFLRSEFSVRAKTYLLGECSEVEKIYLQYY